MLQGRISYSSDASFLMRRDSAEAPSTLLACSSGSLDSVGSSIVKMEYLFDDLMGSTDDFFFKAATRLQNPTQFFPTSPLIPYRPYM